MYDKISDKPIREEKVKLIKEKILKEIEFELGLLQSDLKFDLTTSIEDQEEYENTIETIYYLHKLREYIKWEHSFNKVNGIHSKHDTIIYAVPTKEIDIWLQDDFNFTQNFLFNKEYNGMTLATMLNDDYFGINFTNIIYKAKYTEMTKEMK